MDFADKSVKLLRKYKNIYVGRTSNMFHHAFSDMARDPKLNLIEVAGNVFTKQIM